ncbi:hypothetical protein GGR52DRAFT_539341 [Hypoxylon sp. FL1284]|nr:hypothetical protein GGR52DRAFT_539341 [Hypoxylon sp. FL1284]
MALLTELPPEILQHVLGYVEPSDLAWIPRICRTLYHTVKGNNSLFRVVYLNNFDAPPDKSSIHWEQAVKDIVRLQVICNRDRSQDKKHELPFVYETVKTLLRNAATDTERVRATTHPASRNADLLSAIFKSETNQSAFLCRSQLYGLARGEIRTSCDDNGDGSEGGSRPSLLQRLRPRPEQQQSAHLHCLYGVPLLHAQPESPQRTRRGRMGPFACAKVYDLRQYTDSTKWGPFADDDTDRVDWEKVEAIMLVIGANLRRLGLNRLPVCRIFWEMPFAGTWPQCYKALPVVPSARDEQLQQQGPEGSTSSSTAAANEYQDPEQQERQRQQQSLEERDPYGITGTWLRVVCFLDYSDFFNFNFGGAADQQPAPHVPRRPIDVGEATRLILMKIRVTRVEPPGPDDGQALPVCHFEGISRSLDDSYDENANSDLRGMRGSVRLTREGEVRWTTFSVFNGAERWRSESVQIGGVKSAKGVLGNWFDSDFDPRGPAGPTAFWKVSDKVTESAGYRALMQDFLPLIQDQLDVTGDEYADQSDDDDGDDDEPEPELELEITGISWVTWTDD